MITWISGQSKSGKTRTAKALQETYGGIILDGDDIRRVWTLGFSKEDRWENNLRIAKLAKTLEIQGFDVIVATICPFKELREEVRKITGCRFIYLEGGLIGKEYPYET